MDLSQRRLTAPITVLDRYAAALTDDTDECVCARSNGRCVPIAAGLSRLVDLVRDAKRIALIGNGGSAAIASHLAVDLWTQAGVDAVAPTDVTLITATANDRGYSRVFADFVARGLRGTESGGLVIGMSCSGESQNVIAGFAAAREAGAVIVGLTGFMPGNSMAHLGDLNFYVPSRSYGIVQIAHFAVLHVACDAIAAGRQRP